MSPNFSRNFLFAAKYLFKFNQESLSARPQFSGEKKKNFSSTGTAVLEDENFS